MFCQKVNNKTYDDEGKLHVVADIMCSTVPATMPTTGEDIRYLEESAILDPGTTLYVIGSATVYMMNEENQFVEQ